MKKLLLVSAIALVSGSAFALPVLAPLDYSAASSVATVGSSSVSGLVNVNGATGQSSAVSAQNQSAAQELATHTNSILVTPTIPTFLHPAFGLSTTTVDSGLVQTAAQSAGGTTATSAQSLTPMIPFTPYPIIGVTGSVSTSAFQTGNAVSFEPLK